LLLLLLLVVLNVATARAHEIRPALLDVTETSSGLIDVTWKVPMRGDQVLGLQPVFPARLTQVTEPSSWVIPGAHVQRFTLRSDGGSLVGEEISIDGLSATRTDVLLRLELADGSSHSAILRPSSPSFRIPERPTKGEVAWSYSRMGFNHILEGYDHLLFLFAMLLLVSGFWKLLKTITAFTVAHSVTLALATLGVVNVPAAPTEAIISLSIVFLANEIVRTQAGETSLTERYPWAVAFVFGLFHGLGFAGALSEVGVPQHEVPLALLMFNIGVESGQIVFVSIVACLLGLLRRLRMVARHSPRRISWTVPAYAIGCVAAFWTIERVASFLSVLRDVRM
jgi:hydrogenase/urease accessory protein HupE